MSGETVIRKSIPLRLASLAFKSAQWALFAAAVAAVIGVASIVTVPRLLGWHGIIVLSGSMEPTLKTGGIAFVEKLPAESIRQGDIMTFRVVRGNRTIAITHRVVEVIPGAAGPTFRTRGDANEVDDSAIIQPNQVVGKVRWDVPYLGRVIEKLRDRSNFYLFVGIPASMLVLNELWNIAGDLRQQKRRNRGRGVAS